MRLFKFIVKKLREKRKRKRWLAYFRSSGTIR